MKTSLSQIIKRDGLSGLVIFLIALPLSLGIALASGVPLYSGIVSGVIGGVVVGGVSKSPLSISGPAAGLSSIVLTYIHELGSFELFLCSVVIAGAFQFVFAVLRLGFISSYFPSNVVEGMLGAVGMIIIMKQLPYIFGYNLENATEFILLESGFRSIKHSLEGIELEILFIGLLSLSILIIWNQPFMKRVKSFPASLLVVIIGALVSELIFAMGEGSKVLDKSYFVDLPTAVSLKGFLDEFQFPNWEGLKNMQVWKVGFVIALIASIKSLISIEAIDRLDPYRRSTPTNLELCAQGAGNLISGIFGGLPLTSVVVRSSANLNAGARTKFSAIIHGILLLLCVALIPKLLNKIPLASLSAVLIMVGYRLCKPSIFIHMWKNGRYAQFVPFIATLMAVFYTDILKGVSVGMLVSTLFILRQNLLTPFHYKRIVYSKGEIIKLSLPQKLSFLNKAAIKKTLDSIPKGAHLIIDATWSLYVEFDVLELFREFKQFKADSKGIKVCFIGFKDSYHIENSRDAELVPSEFLSLNEIPTRSSGNYKGLIKDLSVKKNVDEIASGQ